MYCMKKITLIFVFIALFSINTYKAEALSFECGVCTNEVSFVGSATAEISGSHMTSMTETATPKIYVFEYGIDEDLESGSKFVLANSTGAFTTAWVTESYTTRNFSNKLIGLPPGTTFYYQLQYFGDSVSDIDEVEDGAEPIYSGDIEYFTTKSLNFLTIKMYQGMNYHPEVVLMQEILFSLGYYNVSDDQSLSEIADGKFGPMTLSAVKLFQSSNRLVSDGIVGQKTRWALNLFLNSSSCSFSDTIPSTYSCPTL